MTDEQNGDTRGPPREERMQARSKPRWIVRLTPAVGGRTQDLLKVPLDLDIWERHEDCLVAATSAETLEELERRRVGIERLGTTDDYLRRALAHDSQAD